jgi:hypothetical protein
LAGCGISRERGRSVLGGIVVVVVVVVVVVAVPLG